MIKKKRNLPQKPEDFIGWKSDDGLLEVVGIHGKQGYNTLFKVLCHKCSKDQELFPTGYFVGRKGDLIRGKKPCGCSKSPQWNREQFLIITRRIGDGVFIVHGFAEEFHGAHTKLSLECLIDGHKWAASISNIVHGKNGCPNCANSVKRTDSQEALDKCIDICEKEGYEPVGFVERYKNNRSRFEYKCPIHGIQNVSYNSFVSAGTRCKGCWREKQKELRVENGNGNGYYHTRSGEKDFLYVLCFNGKFIKVGRSFDLERRMSKSQLQRESGISNIVKLRIFTATHQEVYDVEQALLKELREKGFQYHLEWTDECFENESLFILNKLLDQCDLEEVQL